MPIGKLAEEKREVAFAPGCAPISDHRRKEGAVLICAIGITLALIPDGATDCIWRERRDHRVVKHAWTILVIGPKQSRSRSPIGLLRFECQFLFVPPFARKQDGVRLWPVCIRERHLILNTIEATATGPIKNPDGDQIIACVNK